MGEKRSNRKDIVNLFMKLDVACTNFGVYLYTQLYTHTFGLASMYVGCNFDMHMSKTNFLDWQKCDHA